MSRQPPDLRPGQQQRPERSKPPRLPGGPGTTDQSWRWVLAVLGVLVVFGLILSPFFNSRPRVELSYTELLAKATAGEVRTAEVDNTTGRITGHLNDDISYSVDGPAPVIPEDVRMLREKGVKLRFQTPTPNLLVQFLPYLLFLAVIIGFYVWMAKRAQGQMTGIMSIGKSKAKVFSTEKPRTTFGDVAGYSGVKQEIKEVVDFLKAPQRFKEIGARIPKGVLLVGPPGTGKTLIARAVAGEAGVPFMSVTGSDFMEMFVGVGASRVRDLFQTARKQAPAIIFVDEIDSIGRKRGAGLGGGHDEREQTLNQMLSEMDGFDTTEGIVMLAATNRPDILDPALLRPGRFDRQVVVPLPDLAERLPILQVHCKDKKMAPDVDLELVARGTPGMSGADLANLVNEAALHAVRRGAEAVAMEDFEAARDRVIMGQRRESVALSEKEKELTAYHEGGHAVLGYVLPNADPVHKVTILPTGMALGVTQYLPMEERHNYDEPFIRDSLAVALGGRVAEQIVFGKLTTGANSDLVTATERARKMVREWGMSDRIGPMAWGAQGQVFLGEDLMHTRDYSDETSRVIDEEVERILREEEVRAHKTLQEYRRGLDAVAAALLEKETIDGAEVKRLVDAAVGRAVREVSVPRLGPDYDPGGTEAGDAPPEVAAAVDDTLLDPDGTVEAPTAEVPRVGR